ncbi:MAG: family 78 glycoside hydrolase catalytic domain [Thermomicrobiales bacterium]
MATTDLTPTNLRCEYLTNPLGIDIPRPRLSWTFAASERGRRQSAYQILVSGGEEALRAGNGDLWDSGRVASSQSVHITYDGTPLTSGQRAYWSVRVWDETDAASAYSDPAWWEMGLQMSADWQGQWIARDQDQDDAEPSPFVRTTFTLSQPVRRARLYATARGLYEAHLNGARVGDAVLSPGWTDYTKRIQYQTYDVGDVLHAGENVLGAILGSGWYNGSVGFKGVRNHYGTFPQFLAQLVVEYEDGTTTTVVTDDAWRVATGPIRASDLLMGEEYDARAELTGWDAPGYAAAAWSPVRTVTRDDVPLVADRAEPVRITEELKPTSITPLDDQSSIVDMGQNMVGWVRLKVRGPAGTRVQLRFAEVLNTDGTLYTTNLRFARQTDCYTLRGGGDEVFEPRFTFHGFRYVEVTGYPGQLTSDAITGCVVESATSPAGTFECSNEMVNRLQRAIVWGQRGNFLSIPTDCPQRDERLGWLADAQIYAGAACCNRDVAAFFTKWLEDVADAQSPEGAFSDVAPRLVDLADGAPAWGDGGVIVPWILYQRYGDLRIIERHYDGMARWLDYIHAANPDYRWVNRRNNDFGDWLNVDAPTPKDLLATAYWAYDADLMARLARALGRESDAARYDALFAKVKAAFIDAYVSADGHVAGDTQTGYVLALHMDLLPDDLRAAATRHLVDDIERHDGHLTTGFVGVGYLCPLLTDLGHVDLAYRLLLNEDYPSWGYMLRNGATTIWERWDGWTEERGFQDPGMNSFNHYAFGSIGEWLFRHVAGIEVAPAHPGYEHVVIRPFPGGGLTWAKAEYQSILGTIASGWHVEDGGLRLEIEIPANVTATVYVPASNPSVVTEGGIAPGDAPRVVFLRQEGDRAVFAVESGRYMFGAPEVS